MASGLLWNRKKTQKLAELFFITFLKFIHLDTIWKRSNLLEPSADLQVGEWGVSVGHEVTGQACFQSSIRDHGDPISC